MVRNEAMSAAMHDLAAIVSSASARRVKPTRGDFRGKGPLSSAGPSSASAMDTDRQAGTATAPAVFVVVPAKSKEQAVAQVAIAAASGCSGVFLTNPDFDYPQLLPIVRHIRGLHPTLFLGVSFHAVSGADAFPTLGRLAVEGTKVRPAVPAAPAVGDTPPPPRRVASALPRRTRARRRRSPEWGRLSPRRGGGGCDISPSTEKAGASPRFGALRPERGL